jgi:hypothetical protein
MELMATNFTGIFTNKENCYGVACSGSGINCNPVVRRMNLWPASFDTLVYCDKK